LTILVIGGTRLSGPFLVRDLVRGGHRVSLYNRGNNSHLVPTGVEQILAPREQGPPSDKYHLRAFADQFRRLKPDVVVHMIAFTREDAEAFVSVFKGVAGRAVVPSSSDVYRAMGIINRTEPGPPIPVPIGEDAPLREKLSLHGPSYEKRRVEQVVLSEPSLPTSVLRFPAVYGPGSYRRQEWIKRMLDRRPAIILGKEEATFRFSHGYAQDIGAATALAAMNERSAGRIFNVGEKDVPTERKRLEDFARVMGWSGRIVEMDDEQVPGADEPPDYQQDWVLDTTRIRRELNFAEISNYDEAIRGTVQWQKENPNPVLNPEQFNYAVEDRVLSRI
jgi:nucleoside-diphosphate-sugar epimerase